MTLSDSQRLHGLVAATHTPFHSDGTLNLRCVETQAIHLLANRVNTVFIGGTTGESHSLALDERRMLSTRWVEVTRGTGMRVVVHVGSNALGDARNLAGHAEALGVLAISALSPSYFKPGDVKTLVACCEAIASAAPATPFYYYDIPPFTNVHLPMPDFLERARDRIPTLAGLKFSNPDLLSYQRLLHADGGLWDVPWGIDEALLAALAVGARGAVGSTYNFAAPIYHRMLAAFDKGDLATARMEQWRSVQLVRTLASHGFMGASKVLMCMLGVDVGPARLPLTTPNAEHVQRLRTELDVLGFFDWIRA
jgi:N-acetylneuraminate lyase